MMRIKRNDIVGVIKGRDRGKQGKVLRILSGQGRALVEGVNLIKKHKRRTQQDQQAGIVSIESPVAVANLMPVCKQCKRPVRVGFVIGTDKAKQRFCRICKDVL